ncbi:MAG TPA: hypothetical protein PKE06_02020 [Flavilitoribacter sp.]|nr:hypothetical protein [Flavilitoribacter sp.]
MRSFKTATTTVALLLFSLFPFSLTHSQTVYSAGSGIWNASGLWNTQPDGSGTPVTNPDDPAVSAVVQAGHAITLPGSADFSVYNLTVENGASLSAGSASNRYVQVFGPQVLVDGLLGGDGLSLDIDGPACTISGAGAIALSRIKKDLDAGAANTTNLTIAADVSLSWSASASLLNQASPSNAVRRTFNVTINPGVTVSVSGDVSIDGINGATNNAWNDGLFTVDGLLDISGNLYVNTANPAGGNIGYSIGNGGRIVVRGQVVGNSGSGGSATATLTVQSGGAIEVTGAGDAFTAFGGGREIVSFNSGALADYSGPDQNIEPGFTYARLNAGGGDKYLTGATQVNGMLSLSGGFLITGDYDLNIGIAGSIAGGSASAYVLTSGTGRLTRPVGSAQALFPVGTYTGYNPVTLSNTGTSDQYSVRVADGVFGGGYSGNLLTSALVDKTWLVDEGVPGGSNATMTVQWNGFDELPGFNRFACSLHHFEGDWLPGTEGPAAGGDPYTRTRSGIQSFSPFAVAGNSALPVSLILFSGRRTAEGVVLDWATGSERDNAFFAVEKQTGRPVFREIGRVSGAGRSDQPVYYRWTDSAPANGLTFYRLRQVDLDGTTAYSPVIAVAPSTGEDAGFILSPSIATDRLRLDFSQSPETAIDIHILDQNGRIAGRIPVSRNAMAVSIPVAQLQPGLYFLSWKIGGAPYFARFIKA